MFKCRERIRIVINHLRGLSRKPLAESYRSKQVRESPLVFPRINAAPHPAPRAPPAPQGKDFLALPGEMPLSMGTKADTVDVVWHSEMLFTRPIS